MKRRALTILSLLALLFSSAHAFAATSADGQKISDGASFYTCNTWNDTSTDTGLSVNQNEELLGYDIPMCITVKNDLTNNKYKTFILNGPLRSDTGFNVFGDYTVISDNDYKTIKGKKVYRYLGLTESGTRFPNQNFPPDLLVNDDVGTRAWYTDMPWTHRETIRNRLPVYQSDFWLWYPQKALEGYLQGVQDHYHEGTGAGNFKKLGDNWTTLLYNAAVWSQFPKDRSPGIITMWSNGGAKDWYDTFLVNPTDGPIPTNDIAINPNYAKKQELDGQEFMELEIFSNFDETLHKVPINYRWAMDNKGNGTWDMKVLSCKIPNIMGMTEGVQNSKRHYAPDAAVKKLGVSGDYIKTKIWVPLVSLPDSPVLQGKADRPIPMGDCVEVTDYGDMIPTPIAGKVTKAKAANDVMENVSVTGATTQSIPKFELLAAQTAGGVSPEAQAAIDESAVQYAKKMNWTIFRTKPFFFVANVNPLKNAPDNEIWYVNNRAIWPSMKITGESNGPFKTPPIDFKGVTAYEGTAYWDDINSPLLDKYILKCSPKYGVNYSGTLTEKTLTGLTPSTTYSCNLEAFDKSGKSGGVEKGSFTTLSVAGPTGSGFWDDRGLIRQIGSQKQSVNSIPTKGLNYADYAADEVKGVANKYSPYFGEKVGVYADPAGRSATYSWQFTYQKQVWDSCKSSGTDSDGNSYCIGGWVTVTDTATDSCQVNYVAIGPEGWNNITTNPTGMTMKVTNDWNNDTANMKVVSANAKQCVGSDNRDPSPNKFTYYVPTTYQTASGAMLMDTGFDSTTNEIQADYTNLQTFIFADTYSLGADGRTLSSAKSKTPIPFKQMWSIYTALGAGN